jgi:hypothetical protein
MSECNFYIHAVVHDVAVGFYFEASATQQLETGPEIGSIKEYGFYIESTRIRYVQGVDLCQ